MFEQIVLGLIVAALGALLVYAFRIRQLYVVIPRLFSASLLTINGKLVEVRAYNKGRATEEDVMVALDPSLKYEIVASSDSTCTLKHSAIQIPRIPPGDDFSVLLLVEGGDFSRERISTISSKNTKGRLLQGIENVPPNMGSMVLVIIVVLAAMAIPIASINYYFEWQTATANSMQKDRLARLDYLGKEGWSELDQYSASKFRDNYTDGEFPIYQSKVARKGDAIEIQFRIVNKSAAELQVTALSEWPYKSEDPQIWDGRNIFSHKVEPRGTADLTIKLYYPKTKSGEATIAFSLSVGTEGLLIAKKRVSIDV
jgi:hypothetical protein